jgi:hypothetical protein
MIGDMTEADARDLMGLVRIGLGFPAACPAAWEGEGGKRKTRLRHSTRRRRYLLKELTNFI